MRKRVIFGIKLVVSVGLLAYLLGRVDLSGIWTRYSIMNYFLLIVPVLLLISQIFLSAMKWQIIIGAEGVRVPYPFLWKSYSISNFISLFLPTSFGGDIYRVYALKRYNLDFIQNAASVAFDRISGLFALTTIAVFSTALFFGNFMDYRLLTLYLLGIILFWLLSSDRIMGYVEHFRAAWIRPAQKILISFNRYRRDKAVLFKSMIIALVFQNNIVWIVSLYCMTMGIDMSIRYLYMVVPLIYLTEVLPISINGIGVRDAAFAFFFVQAGYTMDEAVAVSLLVIAMRYLVAIMIGGSLFIQTWLQMDAEREANSVVG